MVTPELVYIKLLNKINKNNTEGDTALEKSIAVLIINEVKNRWVESLLKVKDSILIDSLWEIVKTKDLNNGVSKDDYTEFFVPDDFYELALSSCEAEKGSCKKRLFLREVKNQDKNILRFLNAWKPNFDFEWSWVSLQDGKIRVYRDDFKVDSLTMEYYKVIDDFDIEGYYHLDGTPSINKPLNLSEQYVDQIINLAAEEFYRNYQNPQDLALSKDRTKSQE